MTESDALRERSIEVLTKLFAKGVKGDAVGHEGYGIHGTIEPDSIGKAVSRGCVRMLNEDVKTLFSMLLPGKSTVTVLP